MGLYWDNGKENGNYYHGATVEAWIPGLHPARLKGAIGVMWGLLGGLDANASHVVWGSGFSGGVIMILENQMQTDIETWLVPGLLGGTYVM